MGILTLIAKMAAPSSSRSCNLNLWEHGSGSMAVFGTGLASPDVGPVELLTLAPH
jgi:hypothetical protein